jgi:hypothetical protein
MAPSPPAGCRRCTGRDSARLRRQRLIPQLPDALPRQNATLWPEFREQQGTLAAGFDALTGRVIGQALEVQAGEAEEHLGALLEALATGRMKDPDRRVLMHPSTPR